MIPIEIIEPQVPSTMVSKKHFDPSSVKELKNLELWGKQLIFWRTHLDIFIEEYFKVTLKDTQKVIARQLGNGVDTYIVQSRGYGKTWLVAICCIALAVLYPGTPIAIVSGSVRQANLALKKIDTYFLKRPDVMREIKMNNKFSAVRIGKDGGVCKFKNGSEISSAAIASMRGERTKIIIIDEAPEVNEEDLKRIVQPTKNYKREICHDLGIDDFESKAISITSACFKNRYFYTVFLEALKKRARGEISFFASALDYRSAARVGISKMSFFEKQKAEMSQSEFDMEYGSIFVGEEANSTFPYDITEVCRTLYNIETSMPKGSTCKYIISLDIATSSDKNADNAIITVLKLIELEDGNYLKRMVYMRSFHGTKLDMLAEEIRKMYIRFPNTIKVVFDHRGLGDSFPQFLNKPWTNPEDGKEYPPWVLDEEPSIIAGAIPMLRAVRADVKLNQALATSLRVALEKRLIELPISSRSVYIDNRFVEKEIDDSLEEQPEETTVNLKSLTKHEYAIFVETDSLQVEMGSIIAKTSESGNVIYTTARTNQRKDRYSSLAMAVNYVAELETQRKLAMRRKVPCIGFISYF